MRRMLPRPAPLLLALFISADARANLRAPRVVPALPSTAPSTVSTALEVQHESLMFRCGSDSCSVRAVYAVRASAAERVELRFVVPVPARVTARFGNASGTLTLVEKPALRTELSGNVQLEFFGEPAPPAYEATVVGDVALGFNELSFEYQQPLGAQETNYGYFRGEGDMVQSFEYGLWPLREWKRAEHFALDFTATLDRPAPNLWQRWFGSVREMVCGFSDYPQPPPALPVRRTQRGDELWLQASVPLPTIPATVRCRIGDDLDD
jgi:hypothetical protein